MRTVQRGVRRIALLFALLGSMLPSVGSTGERVPVTVLQVLDGDTVEVLTQGARRRVRLLAVDAPEVSRGGKPGEPFGRTATRFTRQALATSRAIELEVAGDRLDVYGRTLGFLWLHPAGRGQPVNLSEELLRQGLGRVVRSFEYPDKTRFLAIEGEARRARRGLWRQ